MILSMFTKIGDALKRLHFVLRYSYCIGFKCVALKLLIVNLSHRGDWCFSQNCSLKILKSLVVVSSSFSPTISSPHNSVTP